MSYDSTYMNYQELANSEIKSRSAVTRASREGKTGAPLRNAYRLSVWGDKKVFETVVMVA